MATFEDVFGAARGLSAPERMQLIDALWNMVPADEWPPPNKQWICEAQRRSAEFDAGRMPASSWPEVKSRARRKAGLDD